MHKYKQRTYAARITHSFKKFSKRLHTYYLPQCEEKIDIIHVCVRIFYAKDSNRRKMKKMSIYKIIFRFSQMWKVKAVWKAHRRAKNGFAFGIQNDNCSKIMCSNKLSKMYAPLGEHHKISLRIGINTYTNERYHIVESCASTFGVCAIQVKVQKMLFYNV